MLNLGIGVIGKKVNGKWLTANSVDADQTAPVGAV